MVFFKHFIYSTSLFDNHKTHSRGRRGRDRIVESGGGN